MAVPDGYTLIGEPNRWKTIWKWAARIHAIAAVLCAIAAVPQDDETAQWALIIVAASMMGSTIFWAVICWACRDYRTSITISDETKPRRTGFNRALYNRATMPLIVIAIAIGLLTGCGEPARWETRGFDSEADCWLNHGWDGTVKDGVDRHKTWEFWCG